MRIAIPKETHPGENRIPITPESAKKLCRMGAELVVESGLGIGSGFADAEYSEAGATVSADRSELFGSADLLLRLRKPALDEIGLMKRGCIHISYLDPFNERELVKALKDAGITAISMEMIPRTTRSQKMDALSSQANLAGYVMVHAGSHPPAAHFPDDDDPGRHPEARQRVRHRRRRGGPAGHRHRQAPRRQGHRL